MRLIFAGTPAFAAAHLSFLLDRLLDNSGKHDIVAVYTQPDRRAGRGKKLLASAVKNVAAAADIPVYQPHSLKDAEVQQQLAALNADLMIVAAYGLLLPQAVLDIPRLGCINVHASLLPRWRGAAPIERAIMAGDAETGITIMQMDAGLDTGDMIDSATCSIDDTETGDSLRLKLGAVGGPLLVGALQQIEAASACFEPQSEESACYANKLDKREACIDWQQSAMHIERKIRAFTSALNCYALLHDQRVVIQQATALPDGDDSTAAAGEIVAVEKSTITVKCGQQLLSISQLQLPGSKSMSVAALLNGKPDFFKAGQQFTSVTSNS